MGDIKGSDIGYTMCDRLQKLVSQMCLMRKLVNMEFNVSKPGDFMSIYMYYKPTE